MSKMHKNKFFCLTYKLVYLMSCEGRRICLRTRGQHASPKTGLESWNARNPALPGKSWARKDFRTSPGLNEPYDHRYVNLRSKGGPWPLDTESE